MTEDRKEMIRRLEAEAARLRAEGGEDPDRRVRRGLSLLQVGLALVALVVALVFFGSPRGAGAPPAASKADREAFGGYDSAVQQQIANDVAARRAGGDVAAGSQWRYGSLTDPMTSGAAPTACVASTNALQMEWPYESGGAELCLVQTPRRGLQAYVRLMRGGQILCRPYRDCVIKVRFDDGAVQSFSGADAADGSTDLAFFVNADRMATALKSADLTRVELLLHRAGSQTLEFPTAGLVWPRPAA